MIDQHDIRYAISKILNQFFVGVIGTLTIFFIFYVFTYGFPVLGK
jgi:hypothetical protein